MTLARASEVKTNHETLIGKNFAVHFHTRPPPCMYDDAQKVQKSSLKHFANEEKTLLKNLTEFFFTKKLDIKQNDRKKLAEKKLGGF